jgi:hypothetical protein
VFDRFREAEVKTISGPEGGPSGHVFKVVQGKSVRGEFPATQYPQANEAATKINHDVLAKNPRRFAFLAVAGTVLAASGVAVGLTGIARGEHSAPQSPDADAPAPAETRFITSTETEFVTKTPKPEVIIKIKRVKETGAAKPHNRHDKPTHAVPAPEAPASIYDPPQETYTPPTNAANPRPTPHLTVHHLHEH